MILMALDHASAMIGRVHFSEFWGVPFGGYPTMGWWLTRFLSHLCAPGFFFLMGMSIFLYAEKRMRSDWSTNQISRYFFKRGWFIILLMLFIEFPGWGISMALHIHPSSTILDLLIPGSLPEGYFSMPTTVLYGLGACMIIGGFLWRLKSWQLLSITITCFALSWWYITNAIPTEMFHPLEHLFLVPGQSPGVFVLYPIIPWLGITTFGMVWAQLLRQMPKQIYKYSLMTGLSFVLLFLGLRFMEWGNFNIADNNSWIGFFTLVKYPPSIAFALVTCGINLILFFVFSRMTTQQWLKPVKVFGQTSMFFYLVHLYVYALLGAAFRTGCDLEIMYLMWAIGLIILYPICNRFLAFKKNKPMDSLWRLI